jgi:hypothetical protein
MKKLKPAVSIPAEQSVPLGEMSVKDAIEANMDFVADLALGRKCSSEEIRSVQEQALVKWYQRIMVSILQPIIDMSDLGEADEKRDYELDRLSDDIFNESEEAPQAEEVLSFQRLLIQSALKPTAKRMQETYDLCQAVAEERQLDFSPVLPAPYGLVYERIVGRGMVAKKSLH